MNRLLRDIGMVISSPPLLIDSLEVHIVSLEFGSMLHKYIYLTSNLN